MNAALQEFVKSDSGFGQYADKYEEVSSDMAVRRQLAAWTAEMDIPDIWKAIGRAEWEAKQEAEWIQKTVIKMLSKGVPPETIADYLELPLTQVQNFG